jgi:hypothetical protein
MAWASAARRGVLRGARLGGWPHGDRDAGPDRGIGDDQPCRAAGRGLEPPVTGGAEHAARVVAAPVVTAVRAEEYVSAGAAVLGGAGARVPWLALDLAIKQAGQERRQVDRQARFPGRAAIGVVLRREPVEGAAKLPKLPLNMDLAGVRVSGFQADRLAPAHAGVADRDDHGEVVVVAG